MRLKQSRTANGGESEEQEGGSERGRRLRRSSQQTTAGRGKSGQENWASAVRPQVEEEQSANDGRPREKRARELGERSETAG